MPRRLLSQFFAATGLLLAAGCAGNGCAGCAVTPLPQGFPEEARVENAGVLRITQSGLGFMSAHSGELAAKILGGMGEAGKLSVPIPTTVGNISGIDYMLCPDRPNPEGSPPECVVELDAGKAAFSVVSAAPHLLKLKGTVPARMQDLPVSYSFIGVPGSDNVVLNSDGACPGDSQGFVNLDFGLDLAVVFDGDGSHARHGYTVVGAGNAKLTESQVLAELHSCSGVVTALPPVLQQKVAQVIAITLLSELPGTIDRALCEAPDPAGSPTCPAGSSESDGCCSYGGGMMVSRLIGKDGHAELGPLVEQSVPTRRAGLDFVLAGGGTSGTGNLNPIGGGATLGLYGGTKGAPVSSCVKPANMPVPQAIPIPDELLGNLVSGWPAGLAGPDAGLAINEQFFNYALAGLYDSGALCITMDSETLAPSLSSKLMEALFDVDGVKNLAFQNTSQAVALALRPSSPPTAVFGDGTDLKSDPLIRLSLPKLAIDLYVWSLDRYVRALTFTAD
ncbi:MAG: hypothetical protein R3B70_12090, partial [Polyangiaceae bacterium]